MSPGRLLASLACLSGWSGAVRLAQNTTSKYDSCADVKDNCIGGSGLCRVQNGCFPLGGSSPCKCKDSGGVVALCHKGQEAPVPEECGGARRSGQREAPRAPGQAEKGPSPAPKPASTAASASTDNTAPDFEACGSAKNTCPGGTGLCRVQSGCFPLGDCRCVDRTGNVVALCSEGREVPVDDSCSTFRSGSTPRPRPQARDQPSPAPKPRKPKGNWDGKGLEPCWHLKGSCPGGTGKCRTIGGCFSLSDCRCNDKAGKAVALCLNGEEVSISKKCKDAEAERKIKMAAQAARTAERAENQMWKNKYKWKGGVIGPPVIYFSQPKWDCHYYEGNQDDAWCKKAQVIKDTEYGFFGKGQDKKSPCGKCDCCSRPVGIGDEDSGKIYRFSNYRKPKNTLNFLIVGDWGGNSDKNPVSGSQAVTAKGIAKVASAMGSEFVVCLGDNFYSHGLHEGNKWRFKVTFDDVYTASSLQVPWYQIAGNHDWLGGSIKLQIELTKESPRWVLPAPHYSFVKNLPSGKTIKFVMFDHLQISWNRQYTPLPHSEKKRSHLRDVEWPEKYQTGAEGWSWLDKELKNSKDDYLVLVDHQPVYALCSHGDSAGLRGIPEMMKKYRVTAFMSGHDHCVMTQTRDGLTFILSGAASQPWNHGSFWAKVEHHGGKIDYGVHGHNKGRIRGSFASAEATDSGLQIRHHDQDGNVLHEMSTPLRPRK